MNAGDLTLWFAFGAGLLSFLSPCCLPLYPSFLSYVTGVSSYHLQENKGKIQVMLHTLFFILGFSIIFLSMGFSASKLGELFSNNQNIIRQLGGVFIIFMGLVMLGIFTPRWLLQEKKYQLSKRPIGYAGSILVGIVYAAGWTPCIGPILASIITLGFNQPNQAVIYLLAYTIGFAIPFFLMTFFVSKVRVLLQYSQLIAKIGGVLMIVVGILLYTDQMTTITTYFIQLYGGFTGF
jgi:cytochrome c-type biogenesis protein